MIPYKTYVREDQLFLALYGSIIIQTQLFLKNIENFVIFPKQYLLGAATAVAVLLLPLPCCRCCHRSAAAAAAALPLHCPPPPLPTPLNDFMSLIVNNQGLDYK